MASHDLRASAAADVLGAEGEWRMRLALREARFREFWRLNVLPLPRRDRLRMLEAAAKLAPELGLGPVATWPNC